MIDTINAHTILSAQIVQYDTLGVLCFFPISFVMLFDFLLLHPE